MTRPAKAACGVIRAQRTTATIPGVNETRLGIRPFGGGRRPREPVADETSLMKFSCPVPSLSPARAKGKRPSTPFYGLGNVAFATGLSPLPGIYGVGERTAAPPLRQIPPGLAVPGTPAQTACGLRKWGSVRGRQPQPGSGPHGPAARVIYLS